MTGARGSWWRSNAGWLAAFLVLVPATAGAIGWQEWRTYYEGRHWQPLPVAEGTAIEFAGAQFGPAALTEVPTGSGIEMPAGARALAAQVTVVPGDEPVSCLRPVLIESGTGRTWESEYTSLGWVGDVHCYEATTPLLLHVPFVVPADAGPFTIELEVLHDGPEMLRFIVAQP